MECNKQLNRIQKYGKKQMVVINLKVNAQKEYKKMS